MLYGYISIYDVTSGLIKITVHTNCNICCACVAWHSYLTRFAAVWSQDTVRYCESCELNGKRHPWVNLLDLALSLASSSLDTSGRRFFLTGSATWASAGPSTASDSASLAARAAALSRTAWTEADTMPPMVSLGKRSQKNASIWMHFERSVLNSMYQWLGLILECLGFAYGVQSRCHT